jgi:phage-related protein
MLPTPICKPTEFVGSSLDDLSALPVEVRQIFGFAIFQAELGGRHQRAKPMTGGQDFKGASLLEIVDDFDGNTYRAVYTIRFVGAVYVLHVFQKKSKSGIATPKSEIAIIKARLAKAKEHYEQNYKGRREAV